MMIAGVVILAGMRTLHSALAPPSGRINTR